MEWVILRSLDYRISFITVRHFFGRFLCVSDEESPQRASTLRHIVLWILERDMVCRCSQHAPSMLVAAAMHLARQTVGETPAWTPALQRCTTYTEVQILPCVCELAACTWSQAEGALATSSVVIKHASENTSFAAQLGHPPQNRTVADGRLVYEV